MPLGLDAPTSIGMALLVLGPAFVGFKAQGMGEHAAAIATWQLGMAALVVMGVRKLVLAFFGDAVTRWIPRAGLVGSIAGIANRKSVGAGKSVSVRVDPGGRRRLKKK